MTHHDQCYHPLHRMIWDIIMSYTTAFGRSQAWWEAGLKRSRDEHAEWWMSQLAAEEGSSC